MTHPRAKRGSYCPKEEIELHSRMRDEGLPAWPNVEQRYEHLPRLYDGKPVQLLMPV
ncbi:hypothetical protein DL93DRAFT_2077800 [Clavulina sp. PMI_390]|nr:hypothetical protein DL93DRAFT_2077800 [Clavulina sp. PMI_390]